VIVEPASGAVIRRYAPDSVKFADAKSSTLTEIHKGDQVRARGDRSADGAKLSAEEIVSGAFRLTAGLITEIDTSGNVVRINNLDTKKPMAVKLSPDSTARRLPQQLAQTIANRLHGVPEEGGRGGAAPPQATGAPAGAGEGRGAAAGRGGARGGDLQQMFDRAPAITRADLKPGDAIVVSSTVGASSEQVTAITLFAGVEPILTRPGSREMSLGDWSFGGDLGGFGQ
jgi:hypothetical protein